jgi:hypothetical protein
VPQNLHTTALEGLQRGLVPSDGDLRQILQSLGVNKHLLLVPHLFTILE